MTPAHHIILRLTPDQCHILAEIEETRQWAWAARQDAAHELQLVKARYFIYGATGVDEQDDRAIREVLTACFES